MSLRQERLSNLFGRRDRLCYSVFVSYRRYTFTTQEFDDLAASYGQDIAGDFTIQIPPVGVGETIFNPSYLMKSGDMRMGQYAVAQPVYTQISDFRDHSEETEKQAASYLRNIAGRYKPAIEAARPELIFGDELHVQTNDCAVEFKYVVHDYDMDICHPFFKGKLRPITVIGDQTIHPTSNGGDIPSPRFG